MKLRMAGYQDARSVHTRAMRVLEASLKTKPRRRLSPSNSRKTSRRRGRKVTDLLDLVESGELDLCYFSSSYVTARVPTLGVFDIPVRDDGPRPHADTSARRARRAAGRATSQRGTGYKVLGFWDNGPRHISNRLRAIRMPEDCKGIRIRTLPSAGHHATYRALGMEPVTIDIRDFVEAIASEKVDAQENPLTNVRQFGLQKYHRHVTMTAHFHGIALLLCNAKMLDTCAPALRDALAQAASLATRAQWDFATEDERESRAALEAEGVAIVDLDDAGRAAFRAAVRPLAERQIEALPADLAALLNLA